MMGYGWGMGVAGWIFMGLFWVVVIGLVMWAVGALVPASRPGGQGRSETPEEILDRRFAPGRIQPPQYPGGRRARRGYHRRRARGAARARRAPPLSSVTHSVRVQPI